jgi:uncharacterized protein YraI
LLVLEEFMNRTHLLLLGIGFGLVVPAAAPAQTAYTTKTVNLRAGPSRDYPLVMQLPAGEPVAINGCLDDWSWCDVSQGNDRGWVYARSLDSEYQNRRVVIYGNGPMFGFPIVGFSVGSYWDTYYSGRPWYSRRSYWVGQPQSSHWIGSSGSRSSGVRTQVNRQQVNQPQVNQQPVNRPQGNRQPVNQPQVNRQPVNRPQGNRQPVNRPQVQPQRPQGGRPEAARPQQPQNARPAPARQPDNKGRPQGKDERKPGGN